jgi:recombination protein RecR
MEFGSDLVARLVEELERLPSIGQKTAIRLALHILKMPREEAERLADVIRAVKERVGFCGICGHLTEDASCAICRDAHRTDLVICVVEQSSDLIAIERTAEFRGKYHVLRGAISPLDGIGPDELRVKELIDRLASGKVEEVIVATNPNAAGEATALYLSRLISPLGIRVTRIARGVPIGSDLEYSDQSTLASALAGRREI